jgi:hypothetical protein
MKTEDLITMLNNNVEQVDRRQVVRTVSAALVIAIATALAAAFFILGIRPDLKETSAWTFLILKLGFAAAIAGPTSIYLIRVARPSGERKTSIVVAALPLIVVVILAAMSLVFTPTTHWNEMILGEQWLECLLSIPIIGIAPFAVVVWAVRRMAPTDLVRAGAFAGLAAGAMSAAGYAFHCTDDSLPFVALWYGGTIALCTLAGAILGPRLLRW